MALENAQDKINQERAGNMLDLLDSVLRRNREDREEDDVLFDDAEDIADVKTQDVF